MIGIGVAKERSDYGFRLRSGFFVYSIQYPILFALRRNDANWHSPGGAPIWAKDWGFWAPL